MIHAYIARRHMELGPIYALSAYPFSRYLERIRSIGVELSKLYTRNILVPTLNSLNTKLSSFVHAPC